MTEGPQILVADFNKPDSTYRVAADRARTYNDLLSLAHRILDHPADDYKAHIHFNTNSCAGRAVKCEWDEGWYFGPEFCRKEAGVLIAYVHFEVVTLDEKIEEAKKKMGFYEKGCAEKAQEKKREETARLRALGDEKQKTGNLWEAVWWWKMARKLEGDPNVGGITEKTEEEPAQPAEKKGLPDFVKSEILGVVQGELSSAIQVSVTSRLKSEIAAIVKDSLSDVLDDRMADITKAKSLVSPLSKRKKKRRPTYGADISASLSLPADRFGSSACPWPITYPSQITASTAHLDPQSILTVDAYASSPAFAQDPIVGRARPTACLAPHIRPLVRATLVEHTYSDSSQKHNVYLYIPSRYGKKPNRIGELQIAHDEVEFLERFDGLSKAERSSRILAELRARAVETEKDAEGEADVDMEMATETHADTTATVPTHTSTCGPETPCEDTSTVPAPAAGTFDIIDTCTDTAFLDWDIIIGHARAEVCADPSVRPLVRATLDQTGRVLVYMPARFGVNSLRGDGELHLGLGGVSVWAEFDIPGEKAKRDKIREALIRKRDERMGVERGREAGETCGGMETWM